MTFGPRLLHRRPVLRVELAEPVDDAPYGERDQAFRATTRGARAPGSRPATHHVEQAADDALAIGPQAVVGIFVGDPRTQSPHAKRGVLGQ